MRRLILTVALIAAVLGGERPAMGAIGGAPEGSELTGRWLVLLEEPGHARARAASARLVRLGATLVAPRIGVLRVTAAPAVLERLRRDPAVERVVPEYRRELRRTPSDPALTAPEENGPAGTPIQWALARQNFPAAWDISTGRGAVVGVIDSGIAGEHPQLRPKIDYARAIGASAGDPRVDEDGHGSHVAGLACAATDDGAATAGAGWDCRLMTIKTTPDLTDGDVVAGIEDLAARGVHAINMSFGGGPPSPVIGRAIDFAVERGVVLVAAAANRRVTEQGSPANQLQPGNAADIDAGRGLVVTAADFSDRNAGAGQGAQISLAAYGDFGSGGPPGIVSTYRGGFGPTDLLCGCRTSFAGDDRYAYLAGTSMAVPQVAAVAALVGRLNPDLSVPEKLRLIKAAARRAGGFGPELGWGILDAGAALAAAARADRTAPASRLRAPRAARAGAAVRALVSGSDRAGHPGLRPSGVARYEIHVRAPGSRAYRLLRTVRRAGAVRLRLRRRGLHRLYTVAVDEQGHREAVPRRADAVVRVR